MSRKYKFLNKAGLYFVSFATVNWVDVFVHDGNARHARTREGINKGWENNIMGDSQKGKVDQRNIDGVLKDALKAYDTWSKDKNNKG